MHPLNLTHLTMDQTELLKIHRLNNDNKHNANAIVDTLGGIDNILEMVLSSNIKLKQQTMNEIHEIITNNEEECNFGKSNLDKELTYTFYATDTFWHSLCGDYIGQKICDTLHMNIWLIIIIALLIPSFLFWDTFDIIPSDSTLSIVYMMIFCSYLWIYCISLLLTANKECVKFILRSFEFWIKIFYCLQYNIWIHIYFDYFYHHHGKPLVMTVQIMESVVSFTIVLTVCLYDALQFNIWMKFIGGSVMAFLSTFLGVYYAFHSFIYDQDAEEATIEIPYISFSISVPSMAGNSLIILAIFLWKQSIFSIWKRDRCVLIDYSPFIRWIHDDMLQTNTSINIHQEVSGSDNEHENDLLNPPQPNKYSFIL